MILAQATTFSATSVRAMSLAVSTSENVLRASRTCSGIGLGEHGRHPFSAVNPFRGGPANPAATQHNIAVIKDSRLPRRHSFLWLRQPKICPCILKWCQRFGGARVTV